MNDPWNDLEKEIHWIAGAGFEFIDLAVEPPRGKLSHTMRIKKLLEQKNLGVVGHIDPYIPHAHRHRDIREASFDIIKRSLDQLSRVGAEKVTIHPDYPTYQISDEELLKLHVESLNRIIPSAESMGLTVMLENFVTPFDWPGTFVNILESVPNLSVHLDVGHANLCPEGNRLEEFFEVLADRVIHLHLSDNRGQDDDHLPLGAGNIDWEWVARILKRYKYDGTVTLEVFTQNREYLVTSLNIWREVWLRT
jgi:sugar phosphate isomerase/epimerase